MSASAPAADSAATRQAGAPASAADGGYAEAVEALAERGRFGIRLGLGRTQALLRALGDPQRGLRGALVAGTNGKGSVLALAGSVLRAAGYRIGETPKPHLVSYRERIQVDGVPIAPAAFVRLVDEVLPLADRVARRLGPPTEFELLTAIMFRHFAEVGIDVALVEVGLGGRLDATHAWDGGVAAVTNIGLDHTDRLGSTVEAIAREKAAIIMRGDLAVTGTTEPALTVIRRRARRVKAPLVVVAPAPLVRLDRDGIVVRLGGLGGLGETRVGLRGRHQAANVAVADALLDALETAGIASASPDARRRGYADARWPGRLELLGPDAATAGREVLLDGAHNADGAAALASALADLRPHLAPGPLTLLVAAMRDKDVPGIVRALASSPALAGATVIATSLDLPRAMPAPDLAAAWRAATGLGTVEVVPDPDAALARALASSQGPIVVAGSLYLVGFVRAQLVDDPLVDDARASRP
ncbi:MAG TPA: Mur ligase family protein [Candidatus Limnocylindrales bacterium]|nr:Mur ligase family protein [Candidatus Limnocylindrales bacterium]